jgi:hypothetical protein
MFYSLQIANDAVHVWFKEYQIDPNAVAPRTNRRFDTAPLQIVVHRTQGIPAANALCNLRGVRSIRSADLR